MSYKATIEIDGLPKLPNQLLGAHWRVRSTHAANWTKLVGKCFYLQRKPPTPLKRAKLTLTRYSSAEPDFDGLVGSFKALIDSLVTLGILENDKTENIGNSVYLWQKTAPKKGKIRIEVEEVEA